MNIDRRFIYCQLAATEALIFNVQFVVLSSKATHIVVRDIEFPN